MLTYTKGKDENDLLNRIASLERRIAQLEANAANGRYLQRPTTTYALTLGAGSISRSLDVGAATTSGTAGVLAALLTDWGIT